MARALVNTPSVLLLDEPLSALDERLRKRMQVELKRIQREIGITFVLVTHDQEEALTLSDRIAVMNKGRFEQVGTPAEIYEHPRTRFVTEFVGDSNVFAGNAGEVRDGLLDVAVDFLGTLRVPLEGAPPPGGEVEFFVRPEKLRLSDSAPDDDETGVRGVLRTIIYQGPVTRYDVEMEDQKRVIVSVMNLDAPTRFVPGERLWVRWQPTSGRLLEPRSGRNGAPSPSDTNTR